MPSVALAQNKELMVQRGSWGRFHQVQDLLLSMQVFTAAADRHFHRMRSLALLRVAPGVR